MLNLNAQIVTWNRALLSDINASLNCGIDALAISMPTSDIQLKYKLNQDRAWALKQIKKVIRYAKKHGVKYISIGAEDASRADVDFLVQLARLVRDEGVDRFRYCDTLGILDPFRVCDKIKELIEQVPALDIEGHFHNDFGLATANTLAAIKAGAKAVNTTVYGLGERAGNAPLEEVVLALKYQEGLELPIQINRLKGLAEYVSQVANDVIPPRKPHIGNRVFAHESGIHVDGLIKNPLNYEVINPEEIGQTRQLMIGKHSGSSSLIYKLNSLGIQLSLAEVGLLLPQIRNLAIKLKRALLDNEVITIYEQNL